MAAPTHDEVFKQDYRMIPWYRKILLAVSFLSFLLVTGVLGWWASVRFAPEPRLTIHFLDVGQGDAAFIALPDGVTILIDTGPDNTVVQELGKVMPWWHRMIDYVIITHGDKDHYGGLPRILDSYSIGTIFYSGDTGQDSLYTSVLNEVQEKDITLRLIAQGYGMVWPSGSRLEFLWPPPNFHSDKDNARSLVAALTWDDVYYLFTGDIGSEEEIRLADFYPDIETDVLKVAHHGSGSSSHETFLAAVNPQICILSYGVDNRYGHPHPDVVSRLTVIDCAMLKTPEGGTITLSSTKDDAVPRIYTSRGF